MPVRLLRHTGVYGLFGCTKQSRRRTKATTSPYFHPFGVALQQGPWVTCVKILPVARLGCDRIEGNFVTQSFQAPHKTTLHTLAIPLIEVVTA